MAAAAKQQAATHMVAVQIGETTITGPGPHIRQDVEQFRRIYQGEGEGSDAPQVPGVSNQSPQVERKPARRAASSEANRKRTEKARAAALKKRQANALVAKPKAKTHRAGA